MIAYRFYFSRVAGTTVGAGTLAAAPIGLRVLIPATIRAATRTASIRLDGSASPFQAMSNAVPCATLVRTIGSPSVTLTARSNPTVLSAMWPWSWYIATTASYAPPRA